MASPFTPTTEESAHETFETGSFAYNPSFASSDTSIASYKTQRTIISRKSRYNALPQRKYVDIGRLRPSPQGLVSLDVGVPKTESRDEPYSSPLRAFPIHLKAKLVQESRPSPRSDSFPTSSSSPPPLLPPPESEDEDTTSDDDETDLHTPSTPIDQSTPPQVFVSPSFHAQASYISLGSAASSALVLEVSSSQPAPATPCATCAQPLRGEIVYAIGAIHHFDCFKCIDCGVVVASNFFTIESRGGQRPLCETDYIRRSDDLSLCGKCGLAVRGSYVTALEKRWHLEHFTCTICSNVLAPTDPHYEYERRLYCRQHYLTSFATKCTGCSAEILKDYVKTANDSCWHPECYLIQKFWNVKFTSTPAAESSITIGRDIPEQLGKQLERQLHHIWTVLNTYENENAARISDILREVTNSRYVAAIGMLEKLLLSVEALFAATDDLEYKFALLKATGIPYIKVARVLCHGIFEVFTSVARHKTTQSVEQRAAATLELLKAVAGIARCFNRLIRVALRGALKLQHEHFIPGALPSFLDKLHALTTNVDSSGNRPAAAISVADAATKAAALTLSEGVNPATSSVPYGYRSLTPENAGMSPFAKAQKKYRPPTDLCAECKLAIAGACVRLGTYQRWHLHCLRCQSCNKTAGGGLLPSSTTPATAQVDASDFLYEPMSIRNIPPLGPVPSVAYCTDHAWPTSRSGFLPVSRLEQYAYLLTVSLRRLYADLKDPTLASQAFGVSASPWSANGAQKGKSRDLE